MAKSPEHRIYEFEDFRLDEAHTMLYRSDQEVVLPPKAVETLLALVRRSGHILTKEELMDAVWVDSVVEESNLSQYLHLLRKTLGLNRDGKPFIETLRRRGYRFVGEVAFNGSIESRRPIETSGDLVVSATSGNLIGRTKELAAIVRMLNDGTRLLTLTGVGGVGKTTLARAVANAIRDRGDRVFFVELASVFDPERVVSVIASTVGVREATNQSIIETLKDELKGRETVLILDNFEQVASAASYVADLVRTLPKLRILVTSRVLLNVKTEAEFVVPPLHFPADGLSGFDPSAVDDKPDDTGLLKHLSSLSAIQLFVVRARHARPQFELNQENAAEVAEICSRLEGLPLAIELAAARTKIMSPASMLKRLQNQLKLLTGGPRDMPARQQTMRAAVEWSYDLLNEDEKELFRRLSVFAGGFTLDAAEFVSGANDSDYKVLDGLTSLTAHNLLVAGYQGDSETRFRMLEVIREFASELLVEFDEVDVVRRRHAEYFTAFGEQAEPQIQAAQSAEWLNRLEVEHDNLRTALKRSQGSDTALGQRLAGAIWRFWWLHGHIREGCEQLESFLSAKSEVDREITAKMLAGAAFLNRLRGRSDLSRTFTERALTLARKADDKKYAAHSLYQLAILSLDDDDLDEVDRCLQEGLSLAKELDDKQVLGLLHNGFGELARVRKDYAAAAVFYEKSLSFNREAGDRVRETTNLINLGATSLLLGDNDAAGSFYLEGLKISSAMADMNGTHYCLEGVAGAYWARQDAKIAAILFGAAAASRKATNLFIETADLALYQSCVSSVKESLALAFDDLFAKGESMKLEDAVDLALSKDYAADFEKWVSKAKRN